MRSIIIKSNGSYSETYAKACEAARKLPKSFFRGIVTVPRYDDKEKKLYEDFEVRFAEPGEIEEKLELTPEIIAWFDAVEAKG